MLVTDNEYAGPALQEPNVTAAPDAIWLVYGDLGRDATHAECYRDGEVNWCEESQFPSDVRYVRADIADAAVAAALERRREYDDALVAAERERCAQQFVENGREIGRQEERERLDVKAGACVEALRELDKRLRECSAIPASAADAYDSFYRDMVSKALKAVG